MTKYIDVMVDIETAGTKVTAPLLSLGAVAFNFDTRQIHTPFFVAIDPAFAFRVGIAEGDTITWWMGQSEEARQQVWNNEVPIETSKALAQFEHYLGALENTHDAKVRIWGNASRFDLGIIERQYDQALGTAAPWDFRNEMCYRTLKNSYKSWPMGNIDPYLLEQIIPGAPHTCLPDASKQAAHAISIAHAFSIDTLLNGDMNNGNR